MINCVESLNVFARDKKKVEFRGKEAEREQAAEQFV